MFTLKLSLQIVFFTPKMAVNSKSIRKFSVKLVFKVKILSTATENCCRTLEILCPCTKEELELLVNFLYDGEINISNASVSRKFKENLIKIFGYPKDLSLDDQGTWVNISSKNISSQSSK